jgi:uncharacterized protein YjiS (DUF1127 family)
MLHNENPARGSERALSVWSIIMSTLYHRRAAARINPVNDNRLPGNVFPRSDVPSRWSLVGHALAEWWRCYRSRRSLASLSDYQLRDIGLTRADQLRECSKPFWRA